MTTDIIDGITRLTAGDGKVIADQHGPLGRVVWLGDDRHASEFHEVAAPNIDADPQ